MPQIEPTAVIIAIIGLIGTLVGVGVTYWSQKKRQPVDEQTATAANAAALSKASSEMIAAFRADLSDFRARIEQQESRIEVLETRDRAWSRFYADLHQRWAWHRQQDAAPIIDPSTYLQ